MTNLLREDLSHIVGIIWMNDRLIFHVDVNSAFLSWEAVDRLAKGETLDLRTVPSCVGGDPEKRTSIVSTKSIPAKKYGIVTGEPVATALRKCPELIVVKPNFQLYKKMSHAFKSILNEYTPLMQSFSVDEVFIVHPILIDETYSDLFLEDRHIMDVLVSGKAKIDVYVEKIMKAVILDKGNILIVLPSIKFLILIILEQLFRKYDLSKRRKKHKQRKKRLVS